MLLAARPQPITDDHCPAEKDGDEKGIFIQLAHNGTSACSEHGIAYVLGNGLLLCALFTRHVMLEKVVILEQTCQVFASAFASHLDWLQATALDRLEGIRKNKSAESTCADLQISRRWDFALAP